MFILIRLDKVTGLVMRNIIKNAFIKSMYFSIGRSVILMSSVRCRNEYDISEETDEAWKTKNISNVIKAF